MRLPDSFLQELKDRNNILDVVSGYVNLKRSGRTMSGLCPFHGEKTPSFHVNAEQGYFHCFGCGAGGDVITFIRKIENLDYIDAVKFLAQRAGMELPEDGRDEAAARIRGRIYEANRETARFFHRCLYSEEGKNALAYLRDRGLTERTIKHFGLGYSPNSRYALVRQLRSLGFRDEEIIRANLGFQGRYGSKGALDRFADRVMFPIIDLRGNVIGFGGRIMTDQKPKYLNTSDTMVFNKSQNLYALNFAKNAGEKRLILAEGYMDVISMHQAGIDTAVCACGTALTPDQIKLISQYADEVILSYDSDEAGQKATLRSLELFRNSPVRVGVLQIPGAKDPDEYIKKYGADRFKALLDGVGNALDFRLGRLRSQYDLKQDAQRLEYVKEAVEMLAERSNPTEQEVYAGRLAEETNISKTAIMAQLADAVKKAGSKRRREQNRARLQEGEMNQIKVPYSAGRGALGMASAEQRLLAAMLREPGYIDKVSAQLRPEQFLQPQQKELYEAMLRCREQGVEVSLATLRAFVSEEALNELSRLAAQYSDVNCTPDDIRLYLDRIARGTPVAGKAAEMSNDDLIRYLQSMREKKQGTDPADD